MHATDSFILTTKPCVHSIVYITRTLNKEVEEGIDNYSTSSQQSCRYPKKDSHQKRQCADNLRII